MITIEYTGKRGSLDGRKITCDTNEQAESLGALSTRWSVSDNVVYGYASRSDGNIIDAAVERMNAKLAAPAASVRADAPYRIMVESGRYNIGDEINGWKITGFGRCWRPGADDYSVNNIHPSVEFVCYAYFK